MAKQICITRNRQTDDGYKNRQKRFSFSSFLLQLLLAYCCFTMLNTLCVLNRNRRLIGLLEARFVLFLHILMLSLVVIVVVLLYFFCLIFHNTK